MALTKGLNTTVFDTDKDRYPKHFVNFDVGVEVEMEGAVEPLSHVLNDNKWWISKTDSSLRDGIEYVLHRPVKLSEFPECVDELSRGFALMKPKTSIRTSTHVHVNVLNKKIFEVYQAAFFYYLIEELLVLSQPKERIGNLFCLRMSDATVVSWTLEKSLKNRKYFRAFANEDYYKYSALNLSTVSMLGTLEFRMFQAMMPDQLTKWVNLCYEIVQNGSVHHPTSMLDMYDDFPVKKFLGLMLPESSWFYKDKSEEYLNQCLRINYDRLRDLSRTFGKQTYQVPKHMWNDDLENVPLSPQAQFEALYNNTYATVLVDEPDEPESFW